MDKDKILELCKLIEENAHRIYGSSDPLSENSNLALVILETIDSIRKELTAKPKTNGDRIRAMTDDEIAKFLTDLRTKGYFNFT